MPYSLDHRTRRDEDRRIAVDADSFFSQEFPVLARAHGHLVADASQKLGVPSLTLEVADSVWTLSCNGDGVEALRGSAGGALIVTLTQDQFTNWVQDAVSFNGLLVEGSLQYRGGGLAEVSAWDSLWIALLEGWPVVDAGFTFRDRHGETLALDTSFSPEDDPADIAHFLREAGYLHLRGWLPPEDMQQICVDMDRTRPLYTEGDGNSWWATLEDGSRTCVRFRDFVEHSPTTAKILSGTTWKRMISILEGTDTLARLPLDRRIIEALIKPIGVVSGPSDLTFHRDCHLGRHSYGCGRLTVGIALTAANDANGQLRVIAGSHRLAMPVEVAKSRPYLPVVALPTMPGDLTVHLSCTLHEATKPLIAERRVMYTEIPQQPIDGRQVNTNVDHIRDRMNEIHRSRKKIGDLS